MIEVLAFPAGRNDDQVDSMTQALIWMKDDSSKGRVLSESFTSRKCKLASA